jgi:hypothetical protein
MSQAQVRAATQIGAQLDPASERLVRCLVSGNSGEESGSSPSPHVQAPKDARHTL